MLLFAYTERVYQHCSTPQSKVEHVNASYRTLATFVNLAASTYITQGHAPINLLLPEGFSSLLMPVLGFQRMYKGFQKKLKSYPTAFVQQKWALL